MNGSSFQSGKIRCRISVFAPIQMPYGSCFCELKPKKLTTAQMVAIILPSTKQGILMWSIVSADLDQMVVRVVQIDSRRKAPGT